jgi:hypothetical protein
VTQAHCVHLREHLHPPLHHCRPAGGPCTSPAKRERSLLTIKGHRWPGFVPEGTTTAGVKLVALAEAKRGVCAPRKTEEGVALHLFSCQPSRRSSFHRGRVRGGMLEPAPRRGPVENLLVVSGSSFMWFIRQLAVYMSNARRGGERCKMVVGHGVDTRKGERKRLAA